MKENDLNYLDAVIGGSHTESGADSSNTFMKLLGHISNIRGLLLSNTVQLWTL